MICFSCHKEIEVGDPVGRREECSECGADVHVCLNCEFFDPKSYNECREPSAEAVQIKDRANFCGWFQVKTSKAQGEGVKSERDKLLDAAEALFKKK